MGIRRKCVDNPLANANSLSNEIELDAKAFVFMAFISSGSQNI